MGARRRESPAVDRQSSASGAGDGGPALPASYAGLLDDIKQRIATARVKAALAVNRELIALYWDIGRLIVQRQQREGWGKGVIEQLGRDIQAAFPGIEGFSPRNLWRMRAFYLAYSQQLTILPQAATELAELSAQPARKSGRPVLPQAATELPWFHNVVLLEKVKAGTKIEDETQTRGLKPHRSDNTWPENPRATSGDNRRETRSSGSCSR